jgi:hypothetical protein
MASITTVTRALNLRDSIATPALDSLFHPCGAMQDEARQRPNLNYRLILRIDCEATERETSNSDARNC